MKHLQPLAVLILFCYVVLIDGLTAIMPFEAFVILTVIVLAIAWAMIEAGSYV